MRYARAATSKIIACHASDSRRAGLAGAVAARARRGDRRFAVARAARRAAHSPWHRASQQRCSTRSSARRRRRRSRRSPHSAADFDAGTDYVIAADPVLLAADRDDRSSSCSASTILPPAEAGDARRDCSTGTSTQTVGEFARRASRRRGSPAATRAGDDDDTAVRRRALRGICSVSAARRGRQVVWQRWQNEIGMLLHETCRSTSRAAGRGQRAGDRHLVLGRRARLSDTNGMPRADRPCSARTRRRPCARHRASAGRNQPPDSHRAYAGAPSRRRRCAQSPVLRRRTRVVVTDTIASGRRAGRPSRRAGSAPALDRARAARRHRVG